MFGQSIFNTSLGVLPTTTAPVRTSEAAVRAEAAARRPANYRPCDIDLLVAADQLASTIANQLALKQLIEGVYRLRTVSQAPMTRAAADARAAQERATVNDLATRLQLSNDPALPALRLWIASTYPAAAQPTQPVTTQPPVPAPVTPSVPTTNRLPTYIIAGGALGYGTAKLVESKHTNLFILAGAVVLSVIALPDPIGSFVSLLTAPASSSGRFSG